MTRKGPDMAENWKPGDVAMITEYDGEVPGAYFVDCKEAGHSYARGKGHWHYLAVLDGATWTSDPAPSARRLVVLDPEDREQVARLYVEYVSAAGVVDNGYVDEMQAALREFANPTPPKPDEPTGHLAVVIDTNGNRWINWRDLRDDMDHERPWVLASDGFTYRDYADIDVAEIKWEGIQ